MPSNTDSGCSVDPRYTDVPVDQLDLVRADLHDRLRPVCADMPAAEFSALIDGMARRAVRWSRWPGDAAHLPPL